MFNKHVIENVGLIFKHLYAPSLSDALLHSFCKREFKRMMRSSPGLKQRQFQWSLQASLFPSFSPQIAAPRFPHLGKWASAVFMEIGPSNTIEAAAPGVWNHPPNYQLKEDCIVKPWSTSLVSTLLPAQPGLGSVWPCIWQPVCAPAHPQLMGVCMGVRLCMCVHHH